MFLENSQNSQENTCARDSFLTKLQASECKFIKKGLWDRRFLVNFAKFLTTPFLTEHLRWLLSNLIIGVSINHYELKKHSLQFHKFSKFYIRNYSIITEL